MMGGLPPTGGHCPLYFKDEDNMAEITAALVKELRERTGAGMMECKKALVEAKGNMEAAEDIIAKSGHRKAAKTASRTAAEGKILIANSHQATAIIEVNSETDFVARDESFAQFSQKVVEKVLEQGTDDVEKLLILPLEGNESVEDQRKKLIARLGENIQIRRIRYLKAQEKQRIGTYVHQNRIGAIALIEGGNDELAKELAMHIAAMKPQFLSPDEVPQKVIDREKDILIERAKQSGKPDNILEKIVAGQLQKFLSEICLIGQPFFKDPDQTIAAILKAANAKVLKMIRFEVGEGIEVNKKSFEEEVMSAARGSQA